MTVDAVHNQAHVDVWITNLPMQLLGVATWAVVKARETTVSAAWASCPMHQAVGVLCSIRHMSKLEKTASGWKQAHAPHMHMPLQTGKT